MMLLEERDVHLAQRLLSSGANDWARYPVQRDELVAKLVALLAMPILKAFKHRVDHRRFNGAALLGLRGLVFKSHGAADAVAFENALARAYDAARNRLLERSLQRRLPALREAAG